MPPASRTKRLVELGFFLVSLFGFFVYLVFFLVAVLLVVLFEFRRILAIFGHALNPEVPYARV